MTTHRATQGLFDFHPPAEPDAAADEESLEDVGLPSPGAPELFQHGESDSIRILYQIG